jgi:hypothetical protein
MGAAGMHGSFRTCRAGSTGILKVSIIAVRPYFLKGIHRRASACSIYSTRRSSMVRLSGLSQQAVSRVCQGLSGVVGIIKQAANSEAAHLTRTALTSSLITCCLSASLGRMVCNRLAFYAELIQRCHCWRCWSSIFSVARWPRGPTNGIRGERISWHLRGMKRVSLFGQLPVGSGVDPACPPGECDAGPRSSRLVTASDVVIMHDG